MSEQAQDCTCINRRLRPEAAIFWIRPNGTGFVTARDCPLHGMRDVTPEPDDNEINHTPPNPDAGVDDEA